MARIIQLAALFFVTLFGYSLVVDDDFEVWKADFRQTARSAGITPVTLDMAFTGLLPDHKVLLLDAHQPEFTRQIWEYLADTTSVERVQLGQQRLAEYGDLLARISAEYGVDPAYLLAIWGMESSFGRQTGDYSVIRSLATLAYAGREMRRKFWREQLLAALRMIQRGDVTLAGLRGSWAGAIGHTQFIPTTFEAYAVDFDGDGRRDLRKSIADALASTANYLAKSGWQTGEAWGEEIRLPEDFDWRLADPTVQKTARNWTVENRVLAMQGDLLAGRGNRVGYVYLPAGYRGPAFMLYHNFSVLLKYNKSDSYVLAVGLLADLLQGKPAISARWPVADVALSHAEKSELQWLLSAIGYSTAGVDGKIGPDTRSALRGWQAAVGFPPDGYATVEHLWLLRQQAAVKGNVTQ